MFFVISIFAAIPTIIEDISGKEVQNFKADSAKELFLYSISSLFFFT